MKTTAVIVTIEDDLALPSLYGEMDKNLRLIENNYGVNPERQGEQDPDRR